MAKKSERKYLPFILTKMDEEAGTFSGYASIWDTVDSYGDTVERGAFKRTLKNNSSFHLLWSHDPYEPIGVVTGKEDKLGLWVDGTINQDIQRGREVRSHMKQALAAGVPMGLSIGYQTLKEDVDRENGTRILKEIKLWEISLCLFQACPGANVSDVKNQIVNTHGEPVELCEDCLALLADPDLVSTPADDPPDNTGNPEDYLHLLDSLKFQF